MCFRAISYCSNLKSTNDITNHFVESFLDDFKKRASEYKLQSVIRISAFLDPRFVTRKELFSEIEWNAIRNEVSEMLSENDIEEMDDLPTCNDNTGWAPLEEGNNESEVTVS